MVKVFEALTTLYRFLILLCCTLVVAAATHEPPPQVYDYSVRRLDWAWDRYRTLREFAAGAIEANYKPAILAQIGRSVPKARADLVRAASVYPTEVLLKGGVIPLDVRRLSTVDLARFSFEPPQTATIAPVAFEKAPLADALDSLLQRDNPIFRADRLTLYVGRGQAEGQCTLMLVWRDAPDPDDAYLWTPLACHWLGPQPAGLTQALFSERSPFTRDDTIRLPPGFGLAAYRDERKSLRDYVEKELHGDVRKNEVLGLRIDEDAFLRIGPLVVIALLVTMIAQVTSVRRGRPTPLDDVLFWIGQFQSWRALIMIAMLIGLPTFSVFFATMSEHQPAPMLAAHHARVWSYRWAVDLGWPIVATVATAIAGSIFVIANLNLVPDGRERPVAGD